MLTLLGVPVIGRHCSSRITRDLASDPVILAALVSFYARHPAARAEIGAATLARLRSGDF
ncbi:hypothetical protein [Microbacterium sp. Leaf320]|uniref:hypothetical protein n=1 Tax=Microbacterium sp. Leaf320 TaxID=1736334 RepID=UPI0006FDF8B7|nr:hypothetical protein [Microbacterium sp. Leaf320]